MKRQILSGLASLLYLSIVLLTGMLPHHHTDCRSGAHKDCAACELQLTFAADVPLVTTPITIGERVELPAPRVEAFQIVSPIFLSTASRAPPVAPA